MRIRQNANERFELPWLSGRRDEPLGPRGAIISIETSLAEPPWSQRRGHRQLVLNSSRRYYAHRARYQDLIAQRRLRDAETARELEFIEFAFRRDAARPTKDVLDIACGGGRHVVGLAQRGYQVTGRDFTAERIEVAKARAARAGVRVELRRGDATRLRYANAFDAILALSILFLLPDDADVQRCLRGVYHALNPGGVIICNICNPFYTGRGWLSDAIRGRRSTSRSSAPGIRIRDAMRLAALDSVRGVAWIETTSTIEAPDGRHVFRDRERVRLFTYSDLYRFLHAVGFRDIHCYPDWTPKPPKRPIAEELVFVARK